ncbi:MAG: complex I subunit 5 family protein [Desulfurococcaceae archaeon]
MGLLQKKGTEGNAVTYPFLASRALLALPPLGALLVDARPRISKVLRTAGYIGSAAIALASGDLLWFQPFFVILAATVTVFVSLHSEGYYRAVYGKASFFQTILDLLMTMLLWFFTSSSLGEFIAAWMFLDIVAVVMILMERGAENYRVAATYVVACTLPSDVSVLSLWALEGVRAGLENAFAKPLAQLASSPIHVGTALSLLSIFGFTAKLALFPLHFWLPIVHPEAPSHGSALLSGLVIKMGAYGVLVASQLLVLSPIALYALLAQGFITSAYGYFASASQDDFKRLLAYSSVGHTGMIAASLSIGLLLDRCFVLLALAFVIYHGVVKSLAFLSAALMEQVANTHEISKLGHIGYAVPWTRIVALTMVLNFAGIPPAGGFLAKGWAILESVTGLGRTSPPIALAFITLVGLSSALSAIYSARIASAYFSVVPKVLGSAFPIPAEEKASEYALCAASVALPLAIFADMAPAILVTLAVVPLPLALASLALRAKPAKPWLGGVEA